MTLRIRIPGTFWVRSFAANSKDQGKDNVQQAHKMPAALYKQDHKRIILVKTHGLFCGHAQQQQHSPFLLGQGGYS